MQRGPQNQECENRTTSTAYFDFLQKLLGNALTDLYNMQSRNFFKRTLLYDNALYI